MQVSKTSKFVKFQVASNTNSFFKSRLYPSVYHSPEEFLCMGKCLRVTIVNNNIEIWLKEMLFKIVACLHLA